VRNLLERLVIAVEALAREITALREEIRARRPSHRRTAKPRQERRPVPPTALQPSELDVRRAMQLLRRKR